ncbi:MAG: hypothetical protein P9L98_04380 [Candidatus Kaelpia imicola]|nr:hypothetical protein [Candidatus Kaelpia imicola]
MHRILNYLCIICLLLLNLSCSKTDSEWGRSIKYKGSDLYYTSKITKDDAKRLGDYLFEAGFFHEDFKGSSQITKDNDTYQFRIVVNESSLNDKDFIKNAAMFAATISKGVFDGNQVEIHLCDKNFKTVNIATYTYSNPEALE